ncbi:MAG: hypothetical protein MRY63_08705 [Neomegalonema sp.]|nr:hypothetical protein [Neomegalonema sp.]
MMQIQEMVLGHGLMSQNLLSQALLGQGLMGEVMNAIIVYGSVLVFCALIAAYAVWRARQDSIEIEKARAKARASAKR